MSTGNISNVMNIILKYIYIIHWNNAWSNIFFKWLMSWFEHFVYITLYLDIPIHTAVNNALWKGTFNSRNNSIFRKKMMFGIIFRCLVELHVCIVVVRARITRAYLGTSASRLWVASSAQGNIYAKQGFTWAQETLSSFCFLFMIIKCK